MINIFNTNRSLLLITLLAVFAFAMNVPVLLYSEWYAVEKFQAPLYQLIVNVLKRIPGNDFYFFFGFSVVLVLIQALLINRFVNEIKLFPKPTFVPALAYLICASLFREFLFFSPVLVINTFIIIIVILLFSIYKNPSCERQIFDVGFFIGICSLIYFPSISLALLFFIGLSSLRPFAWREWVIGLTGIFTPFFLAGTIYFWNDQLGKFLLATFESVYAEFKIEIAEGPELIWIGAPMAVMMGMAVMQLQQNFLKSPVHFRKFLTLMLWAVVILLFSSLFLSRLRLNHFLILSAPLSIILSYFFLSFRKWYVPEIFFWTMLLIILTFQYL